MPFPFDISATEGRARTGVLKTPRGDIRTPAFMPVGTAATVKAMTVDQVAQTGADILLGNTYHLMLRPGPERMERLGGLHKFMGWTKPILTDSGGFQVMSLAGISKVKEEAVTFASHIDGSKHVLSPERSIEIQADRIGADISMQLDQCVSWPAEEAAARAAMELSARWGARSKAAGSRMAGVVSMLSKLNSPLSLNATARCSRFSSSRTFPVSGCLASWAIRAAWSRSVRSAW